MSASPAQETSPTTTAATSPKPHASEPLSTTLRTDPLLSAFLSPDFSATTYLNRSLPAYSPHYQSHKHQQHQQQQQQHANINNSLSTLHSAASSLLSELDVNLNKLQATLSGLTDDILRVTPRLGYEVEVLRSDILTVAETLASDEVEELVEMLKVPALSEVDGDADNEVANGVTSEGKKTKEGKKDDSLQRLRMLVQVRDHLEEVIKIFGDAMEWTMSESQMASSANAAPTGLPSYAPPVSSSTTSLSGVDAGATATAGGKVSGSEKIEQEINYLITSNELEKASKRVEDLSKLLSVWQNTPEYAVRSKFVDGLRWKVLEASKEEELAEEEAADTVDDDPIGGGGSGTAGSGRDGYYSLINQLQRMRGMG